MFNDEFEKTHTAFAHAFKKYLYSKIEYVLHTHKTLSATTVREQQYIDKIKNELYELVEIFPSNVYRKRISHKGRCQYCKNRTGSNHKTLCPINFQ